MNPDAVVVEGAGYTGPVRRGDVIRAVVFDAGNTLVRMNYVAISGELATLGVRATPAEVQRDPDQKRPSLHGRLSFTFLSEGSREQHYCFRLLGHTHPRAFQTRLKAAMTASGIDAALKFRHLFILRGGRRRDHMRDQVRPVRLTGFGDMGFVPKPCGLPFLTVTGFRIRWCPYNV